MKRLLILAAVLFNSTMVPLKAQTMADDAKVWAAGWKHAISAEGRQAGVDAVKQYKDDMIEAWKQYFDED